MDEHSELKIRPLNSTAQRSTNQISPLHMNRGRHFTTIKDVIWIADALKRRKPALIGGALVMLASAIELSFAPALLPAWLTLLVLGIASGSAMIPYTIIKEVNPDCVKGSAIGGINFVTFLVSALLGPVFAFAIGKSLGLAGTDPAVNFREFGLFWVGTIALALLVSLMLNETGHALAQARSDPRTQ